MDVFGTIIAWAYQSLGTWYVAGIVGGVLILFAERRDRRREPSDDDVRRAAEQYRQYYGAEAFRVIGDHMLAAAFAPDGRHRRMSGIMKFPALAFGGESAAGGHRTPAAGAGHILPVSLHRPWPAALTPAAAPGQLLEMKGSP